MLAEMYYKGEELGDEIVLIVHYEDREIIKKADKCFTLYRKIGREYS
jgi:hypothetical protein